jgi:hypothetical protein
MLQCSSFCLIQADVEVAEVPAAGLKGSHLCEMGNTTR